MPKRFAQVITVSLMLSTIGGCGKASLSDNKANNRWDNSPITMQEAALPAADGLSAAQQLWRTELIKQYSTQTPSQWGETVSGVFTRMATNDKVIALTFDACGGPGGNGFDSELIDYLIKENVPATLFINARWIDANLGTFMSLARNLLFEIENHGYLHRPLSVNGKTAWGISGTKSIGEVVDEVLINAVKIQKLTGRRPIYFRSGTAFYDEVAIKVVDDIGLRAVNYNVLGDAGATFNPSQIKTALLSSKNGSIVICHMNHPEKSTAEGIMASIPQLKRNGFRFVKLATYPLK
ncbi:polysaccharide deacetylase family protein [Paenibacillus albus]|uniref:Polysaccharide deacetylase n=1 Tax=Paenibacillus albus TaxID=2495582 RepID=A0A3Q8X6E2_9BACL|nr:polysaccharide deacetylase family protein [Paenibacillus albus]AZN41520.1 polysaccharide deacetylase [Paenibacillus albus]